MELENIIGVSDILVLIASIISLLTLFEIKRQRNSTLYPDLVFENIPEEFSLFITNKFEKIELLKNIHTGSWHHSKWLEGHIYLRYQELYRERKDVSFENLIINNKGIEFFIKNVGINTAKRITIEFIKNKNISFSKSVVKRERKNIYKTIYLEYLQADFEKKIKVRIPVEYLNEYVSFIKPLIETDKFNSDTYSDVIGKTFNEFPKLFIKITYEDYTGKKFNKRINFEFKFERGFMSGSFGKLDGRIFSGNILINGKTTGNIV